MTILNSHISTPGAPRLAAPKPPPPRPQRTLADLFDAYLAEAHSHQAPSTHYFQRKFLGQVLHDLGPLPLVDITRNVLQGWKGLLASRYQPATVWRYLMYMQRVLAYEVEWDWLPTNPLTRLREPSHGRGRTRFLTEEELPRLLAACGQSSNRWLYPMVVVALTTGGRKNEIRQLQWPHVDFNVGVLRFLKPKTHQPRAVPLLSEARQLLEALAQRHRPAIPWVFPGKEGHQPALIDYAWGGAVKRAAVPQFRFHDLRHTFASYMAMSGASLRDIAEVLGHANITHTMRYAHLLPSHTTAIVTRMTELFLTTDHAQEGAHHDHS